MRGPRALPRAGATLRERSSMLSLLHLKKVFEGYRWRPGLRPPPPTPRPYETSAVSVRFYGDRPVTNTLMLSCSQRTVD